MIKKLSIGCAALILTAFPLFTFASDSPAFVAGRWSGAIHAEGQPTAFHACSATAPDLKKTSVTAAIDRAGAWSISFRNPGWHIPKDRHYRLHISIDGGPALDWDSVAEAPTLLTVALGSDGTLITLLRRGHSLEITSGTFDQTYSLEGTDLAIGKLIECRQDAMTAEASARSTEDLIGNGVVALTGAWVAAFAIPLAPIAEVGIISALMSRSTVSVAPPIVVAQGPSTDAAAVPLTATPPVPVTSGDIEIPVVEEGGTYVVPVVVNDVITLDFMIDSGASTVVIPADVVRTLARAGTVAPSDYGNKVTYTLADGSTVDQDTISLRSLRVGGLELRGVVAGVAPPEGSLLLGQSFLGQFQSWSIDNDRHVLILRPKLDSGLKAGAQRLVDSLDLGL